VLCESVFALARADQRGRLSLLLERLPIAPLVVDDPSALRREIFAWLAKYAEHDPDYADAELCVLAARDKRLRIWTYDSEFTRVWRKSSGRTDRPGLRAPDANCRWGRCPMLPWS